MVEAESHICCLEVWQSESFVRLTARFSLFVSARSKRLTKRRSSAATSSRSQPDPVRLICLLLRLSIGGLSVDSLNRAESKSDTHRDTRDRGVSKDERKRPSKMLGLGHLLAGSTGLEPAASGVTGLQLFDPKRRRLE